MKFKITCSNHKMLRLNGKLSIERSEFCFSGIETMLQCLRYPTHMYLYDSQSPLELTVQINVRCMIMKDMCIENVKKC